MYTRMSKYDLGTKCSECLKIKRLKQKKRRHKKSSSLKGVDPKFLKNQKFARKGTPFSGLTLYMKNATLGNLPSADVISLSMYCYLRYTMTPFRVKYTSRAPYMRILDETYEVDRDLPFEQLKVVGKDLDEVVRQHGEFQSFEKQTIDQLDRLEMAQLYYLYQKFPSFDWARQKFESIKKKLQLNYSSEEQIEVLGKVTCKALSEILKDSVTLFRIIIKEGQWPLKEDFAVLEIIEGDRVKRIDWDFNPCTTLDVTLTRILLVIKNLVDTPIHKEFIKYPNLLAYVERFFVKFVKNKDVVDLSSRRGSYDFVETLIKQSDRIGVGSYCNVYLCKFPQRNLLDLPAGTYVVKSLTALGANTYFGEKVYLQNLQYDFTPKFFGYGEDGVRRYLIMQYGGGTLTQRIGELQYSEVMTILIDVCNALHAIHSHGTDRLLHDDLAPRNILITKRGRAKLIDFGTMSYVGCNMQNTNSIYRERKWDKCNGVKQVTKQATQSRDIFSFGIIMIEMLTNEDLGGANRNMESVLNLKLKCEGKVPYLTIIRENIQQSGCNEDRARELVDLALLCIRRDGELYPRAHEVSSKLMTIRDIV